MASPEEALRYENEELREEVKRLMAKKEQLEMTIRAGKEEASRQVVMLQGHKNTLAGEVFKLRQEKDELFKITSGSLAKTDGSVPSVDPIRLDVMNSLKQSLVAAQEEKEKIMEEGQKEKVFIAKEIKVLREQLVDAQGEERRLEAGIDAGARLTAASGSNEKQRVMAAIAEKEKLDELFLEQAVEMRQNLRASALNRLAQGNSQLTIHQLIAISNDQIHRIVNQASNLKADKIVQKEFVNLLHENGSIRRTLNEYAEGLLRDPPKGSAAAANDMRPYQGRLTQDSATVSEPKPAAGSKSRVCGMMA
jgi:hypothetical protein